MISWFAASPEAESLLDEPSSWMDLIQSLCLNYLGVSLGHAGPAELDEVLLEWIPRKVSMPPSDAHPLFVELRAFMAFAAREFCVPEAKSCLGFLTPDVEHELEPKEEPGNDSRLLGRATEQRASSALHESPYRHPSYSLSNARISTATAAMAWALISLSRPAPSKRAALTGPRSSIVEKRL